MAFGNKTTRKPLPCPECGTIVTVEYENTLWNKGWQIKDCPSCGYEIDPEQERYVSVVCTYCNHTVEADLLEDNQICSICKKPLQFDVFKPRSKLVSCPHCGQEMEIEPSAMHTSVTCVSCRQSFVPSAPQIAPGIMRITNAGMYDGDVLWYHPAERFNTAAVVEIGPGTIALLIDGMRCLATVENSGRSIAQILNTAEPEIRCRVVYVRRYLNRVVLFGTSGLQLNDGRFRIRPDVKIGLNGSLDVEIRDAARFAAKVRYLACTEASIGLKERFAAGERQLPDSTNVPRIVIRADQHWKNACSAAMNEVQCGLSGLADHTDSIRENFAFFAERELMEQWGIGVCGCNMNMEKITRDMFEEDISLSLEKRVSRMIDIDPISVEVHLNGRSEYRADLLVKCAVQLSVENYKRLIGHMDALDWERSSDENFAARDIGQKLYGLLRAELPAIAQSKLNSADIDIRDLNVFNHGISGELLNKLNANENFPYLYDRGLKADSVIANSVVAEMSGILKEYYKTQEIRELAGMKSDQDEIHNREDIDKIRREDEKNDALAQAEAARRRREHELDMLNRQFRDEAERVDNERKMALNELHTAIRNSEMSLQEKEEAFARARELEEVINETEISRRQAESEIEIKTMAANFELDLSEKSRRIILDLEQAQQQMNERQEQAEHERALEIKRMEIEASFKELQMKEEIRRREFEAEERRAEQEFELSKFKIMVEAFKAEMDVEKAARIAEAAAKTAEEERRKQEQAVEARMREEHAKQAQAERDSLGRMLDELQLLRGSLNRNVGRVDYGKIDDLISRIRRQMGFTDAPRSRGYRSDNNRGARREYTPGDRRNNRPPYPSRRNADNPSYRSSDAQRSTARQPGVANGRSCPKCHLMNTEDARFCAECGAKL